MALSAYNNQKTIMTLPSFPVAVVFPLDDYNDKADMLKVLLDMPFVPDHENRLLVFSTILSCEYYKNLCRILLFYPFLK